MRHQPRPSLAQIMPYRLVGAKELSEQNSMKFISPWCHIYAPVNRVSIGLDNGLSPIRRQAII